MKLKALALLSAIALALALVAVASGSSWLFGDAQGVKDKTRPDNHHQQLRSDADPGWGGIDFKLPSSLTFAGIHTLSTDYNVTDDDCFGGSPRFQVNLDTDGDGDFDGNVFVYIGPFPSFSGCAAGWQSTGNLIAATDNRFDTSQVGGTFYDSHAGALALVGSARVLGVQLVVDSGWGFADGEQTILVDEATVNNTTVRGKR